MDMCDVHVAVAVVVVVDVCVLLLCLWWLLLSWSMVSAFIVLCVCFVAVVCPLWCAHVIVLVLNTTILRLLFIDHCGSQDPYKFLRFSNNYAKFKTPTRNYHMSPKNQLDIEKYQIHCNTLYMVSEWFLGHGPVPSAACQCH